MRGPRRIRLGLGLALGLSGALAAAAPAGADGGRVCASVRDAGLVVTVFVSPTPLRVGPAEVAALVQDTGDAAARVDARVDLSLLRAGDPGAGRTVALRTGVEANRLLYSATLALDATGPLSLRVEAERAGQRAVATCSVEVEERAAPLVGQWPLLVLPPVAIALYAAHQVLAARQAARRSAGRRRGRSTPDRPRG